LAINASENQRLGKIAPALTVQVGSRFRPHTENSSSVVRAIANDGLGSFEVTNVNN
jgi:hypothetical protein